MKKGCLGCTLVLVVLGALMVGWVTYPPARQQAIIEQACQRYAGRSAELLKKAREADQNGLLEPSFYPWWGPKAVRKDPPTGGGAAVVAWNEYSEDAQGEPVDHRGLLARRDPQYLKAREAFAKELPALGRAFSRPVFTAEEKVGLADPDKQYNFIALRSAVQALSGYAHSLAVEGKTDEAVVTLLPALQLGRRVMGEALITDMIGVALQAIASNGIFRCLETGPPRQDRTWVAVMEVVRDSLAPPHQMASAMEGEIAMTNDAFAHPEKVGELQPYSRIPGLYSREVRLYNNDMGELLQMAQAQEVITLDPTRVQWSAGRWALGRVGLISSMMVANYDRASNQLALGRRRLVVLHTLAALRLYQQKKGAYPDQLAQLQEFPLQPLPGFEWTAANFAYQKKGKGAECELLLSADLHQRFGTIMSHDQFLKLTPTGIRVPLVNFL